MLGRKLRHYRNRAELKVAEASRRTGISETKLRKVERGVNDAIRLPDLYAYAAVYGLTSEESLHIIELAENADSHGWYHDYDVPSEFAHFIELESAASSIHIFELEYISGLFQTQEYLDGLRANRPGTKGGADNGLRLERQEAALNRADPPSIIYATTEAALRRQVGGPEVMRAQIQRLLEVDERDNIEISVVPFSAGAHPGMAGSYWIMYFADEVFPTTVYLESLHGSHYEEADKIVGHYEAVFQQTRQPPLKVPIKEFVDANNLLA